MEDQRYEELYYNPQFQIWIHIKEFETDDLYAVFYSPVRALDTIRLLLKHFPSNIGFFIKLNTTDNIYYYNQFPIFEYFKEVTYGYLEYIDEPICTDQDCVKCSLAKFCFSKDG